MDWVLLGLLAVGGLTALALVLLLTTPKSHARADGDADDADPPGDGPEERLSTEDVE